jgi:hypothetical protein
MNGAGSPVHPYYILDECLGISYRGLDEWLLHHTIADAGW